ncbi:MAG: hypothetical protein ACI8WB_004043 [Phenylobacterium sp.]|jgi:hypothetical protein
MLFNGGSLGGNLTDVVGVVKSSTAMKWCQVRRLCKAPQENRELWNMLEKGLVYD